MQTLEIPQTEQWTPELLQSLPDEFRYEVREGNLVVMAAAMRFWHGRIQARLVNLLGDLASPEQGIILGEGALRICDVGVFYQQPPGDRAYHYPSRYNHVPILPATGAASVVERSSCRSSTQPRQGALPS